MQTLASEAVDSGNMDEVSQVLQCLQLNDTVQVEENRDWLNDLPDDLFDKIVSFLDTDMKNLVQASLLCKRWRYVWLSIPNLNFDKDNWKYGIPVSRFVDNVLLLRNASDICKLSLTFPVYHCVENIESWITHAVSQKVQEIHITGVNIRPSVFSKVHVKTLKLSRVMCDLVNSLDLPNTEHLVIDHLSATSFRMLKICAPRLKTLVLDNARDRPRSIDIRSPDLAVVKSEGFLYQDFLLENISSLRKAELSIYWNDLFTHNVLNERVMEALSMLSNTESLTLSVRDFEELETISKLLCELKMLERSFGKTKYLEVKSRHNSFSDAEIL